jgi:hypothetical protein
MKLWKLRRFSTFSETDIRLSIKDGKIWIQHDGTEGGIANDLVDHGVPKHDIVLGFHAPFKRQFTDFAVG